LLLQYVDDILLDQPEDKEHGHGPKCKQPAFISMKAIISSDDKVDLLDHLLRSSSFKDFELVSSDLKVFKCHKIILAGECLLYFCSFRKSNKSSNKHSYPIYNFVFFLQFPAHSEELERIIVQKQNESEESKNRLELEEDGDTVSAFVNWLYTKNTGSIESSFHLTFGLLKLGHRYKVLSLIGFAAKILIRKCKYENFEYEWRQPKDLWKLYRVVRFVDKIETVVKLNKVIVCTIRR